MEKFAILYKMWLQKILRTINGIIFLSVVQDCKNKIKNPERVPDFWEKLHGFLSKS
jgi:hypothetical protein